VRLDVFLVQNVPGCSRRTAQRAVAAGAIRVNDRRARKGHMLRSADIVQVADDVFEPPTLQPDPQLAVPVLYEDAAVVVLDKPPGMPSHALRAAERGTVANFLLARYPELARVGKSHLEPGIVHRLDTDTSGILLVARSAAAYDALRQQFSARRVIKEYLAVVHGHVGAAGEVCTAIAHAPRNRRRMRVYTAAESPARARQATTYYTPLERLGDATLLLVRIPTGVMHQIRVHLASIGHAIVGDRLYGRASVDARAPRQLLHAHQLAFEHPQTGMLTRITCEVPADFRACVRSLKEHTPAPSGRALGRPGGGTRRA